MGSSSDGDYLLVTACTSGVTVPTVVDTIEHICRVPYTLIYEQVYLGAVPRSVVPLVVSLVALLLSLVLIRIPRRVANWAVAAHSSSHKSK